MNVLKFIFLLFIITTFSGCDLRMRERNLQQRADSINQKEQQLILLENQIAVKQTDLEQKERTLDSLLKKYITPDSLSAKNPLLVGRWNVRMICKETTCPGSAVGDNKTEVWEIGYQDNAVIAKAMVNNQLVRVYSGTANENQLILTAQQEAASMGTNISVTLLLKNETEMEGERKIIRPEECRIIYALQMQKIVTP